MSVTNATDYEHWPDDTTIFSGAPSAVSGYDNFNGLRECEYAPANDGKTTVKSATKAVAKSKVRSEKKEENKPPVKIAPRPEQVKAVEPQHIKYDYPPAYPPQYTPQYTCFPMPYGPNYALPAPAYYGFPLQQMQQPSCVPPGFFCSPADVPPSVPVEVKAEVKDESKSGKEEKLKPKKAEPMKWQGRTKTEVEEDNMKIAAKEGAYVARKIEPVGMGDDQPVWVVLGDGKAVLR